MTMKIIRYASPGCLGCAAIKRYLEGRALPFEERDVTAPGVAEEAKARYGLRVAPITVIGDAFFYGPFAQQKPKLDACLGPDVASCH
ncbi:MAG: glutaredoxin family protein [Betaproteobacteria bacterium]|nr:glutaredoxin family protein [Betaproteobacteria bacterium]